MDSETSAFMETLDSADSDSEVCSWLNNCGQCMSTSVINSYYQISDNPIV